MSAQVLLVEDHDSTRTELQHIIESAGYGVLAARHGREALALLSEKAVDLVLSDYRMEPVDGLELLRSVRRKLDIPFILYSAGADAETIFRAGRAGAVLFLEYPFHVESQLLPTLAEALAARRGSSRPKARGAERLVGVSAAIGEVREKIQRLAPSRATVLITGETGTGKELVARAIHEESGRDPFVPLSVPELAEGVLESELFGHARGAFTGAAATHAGFIERADGGTLFLDEIGDVSASVQAKLLRVLETGEVRPLGGTRTRRVETRFVAATHRDLAQRVRAGAFREDLYYRIHQTAIHLPPLADRSEDIPPIAHALLCELAREARLPAPSTTPDFLAFLQRDPWPGNVRELHSFLQNVILGWDGSSRLTRRDAVEALAFLHPPRRTADPSSSELLLDAYRRNGGNQEAARRELGLSRGEWRSRWKRFGLDALTRRRR